MVKLFFGDVSVRQNNCLSSNWYKEMAKLVVKFFYGRRKNQQLLSFTGARCMAAKIHINNKTIYNTQHTVSSSTFYHNAINFFARVFWTFFFFCNSFFTCFFNLSFFSKSCERRDSAWRTNRRKKNTSDRPRQTFGHAESNHQKGSLMNSFLLTLELEATFHLFFLFSFSLKVALSLYQCWQARPLKMFLNHHERTWPKWTKNRVSSRRDTSVSCNKGSDFGGVASRFKTSFLPVALDLPPSPLIHPGCTPTNGSSLDHAPGHAHLTANVRVGRRGPAFLVRVVETPVV